MALLVFSAYACIRFQGLIPVLMYATLPGIFLVLIVFCVLLHTYTGNFYSSSLAFIACQRQLKSKEMKKRVQRRLAHLAEVWIAIQGESTPREVFVEGYISN